MTYLQLRRDNLTLTRINLGVRVYNLTLSKIHLKLIPNNTVITRGNHQIV
jgi:hypothetical protein